jgi:glycosyltransferase involved in cell wall biosynthesis
MGLSPISYYRVSLPLTALAEVSDFEARTINQRELLAGLMYAANASGCADDFLAGYDAYVISRFYKDKASEVVDAMHNLGGYAVFDTDDDLTEEHREFYGRGDHFIETVRAMDLVTVSTPYLKERLEGYNDSVHVLPNHIDTEWFGHVSMSHERMTEGLTVGVVGTKTHYDDWRCVCDPLKRLAEEHDITVLAAGFQPDYLEWTQKVTGVPYRAYPALMREFDIVCCALDADDRFNWSKSAIKALEAMAAARELSSGRIGGAVPVCTDMHVYNRVVKDGVNGVLVDNDGWYSALCELINDQQKREALAARGHRWVRRHRDIRDGCRLWGGAYRYHLGGQDVST